MLNEEWRYEWIRTLVKEGLSVETAQAAYRDIGVLNAEEDPVSAAHVYLSQREPAASDA